MEGQVSAPAAGTIMIKLPANDGVCLADNCSRQSSGTVTDLSSIGAAPSTCQQQVQDCEAQSPFVARAFLNQSPPPRDGTPPFHEGAPASGSNTAEPCMEECEVFSPLCSCWDVSSAIRQQQLRERELAPSATYMARHAEGCNGVQFLTPEMRVLVVSWMVEVADEFGLQAETLHQAVSLLDRFLSSSQGVPRGVLQMLAVACIMVAAKDLEVTALTVQQLTSVAANSFTADDLRRAERVLLDALDFRLAAPNAASLTYILHTGLPLPRSSARAAVLQSALYLTELALLDYSMLAFLPSEVAASALLLALQQQQLAGARQAQEALLALAALPFERLEQCASALVALQRAAAAPATQAAADLLQPVRFRYSPECTGCFAAAATASMAKGAGSWGTTVTS